MVKAEFLKKFRNLKHKACSMALALTLVTGLVSGMTSTIAKAKENEMSGQDWYNQIMGNNSAPADFGEDKDPFGYGLDKEFMLYKQQELFVYKTNGGSEQSLYSYDNIKEKNEGYPLDLGTEGKTVEYKNHSNLSYVQSVAFDPDGTGRKDHVAIIGVDGSGDIKIDVMDKDGKWLDIPLTLGTATWMKHPNTFNNDNIWDFNAMNFMDITAGDYDNDGKDTLVVWACLDNNDYGLFELIPTNISIEAFYSSSPGGSSILALYDKMGIDPANIYYTTYSKRNASGNKQLLHDKYPDIYKTYLNNGGDGEYVDNKLHADIDTGDITGDGIDDLVVLSYVGRMTDGKSMRKQVTDLYRPLIAVRAGADKFTGNITDAKSAINGIWTKEKDDNGRETGLYIVPLAAGLAVGDVDGDGLDEMVVSGFMGKVNGTSGQTVTDSCVSIAGQAGRLHTEKLVTAIYDAGLANGPSFFDYSTSTNQWTRGNGTNGGYFTADTTAGDQSWQRMGVETVAFDGKGKAEKIFINGDIYDFDGKNFKAVYQSEYFSSTDIFTTSRPNEETYIRSMAVGTFDGNEEGHEQIVFVQASATKSDKGKATYSLGMIGGVYEQEGEVTDTAQTYYTTTKDNIQSNYYPSSNLNSSTNDCFYNSYQNLALCAWDNDLDGQHVKYVGKNYIYSDPDVLAILQAPPYFKEVKSAMSEHSTSYSIKTSYQYDASESLSTSFGIGGTFEWEAKVVEGSVALKYSNEWTKTFTNSLYKGETNEFTVEETDKVVICRTPVIVYNYQIENENGWTDENILSCAFPSAPVYSTLTIDDYNKFAEYYNIIAQEKFNAEQDRRASENEEPLKKENLPHLDKIDDPYLGHAGDPDSYMKENVGGVEVLQSSPNEVVVGDGKSSFSFEKEHSKSEEETMGHGFSFDFSILFGPEAHGFKWRLGLTTSLDFMRTFGVTITNGTGTGAACTISNINEEALNDLGFDKSTAQQYTFSYQMITWPSKLISKQKPLDEDDKTEVFYVPIYGYKLSGVKNTLPQVKSFGSELTEYEKVVNGNVVSGPAIKLTWENPSTEKVNIDGYKIFVNDNEANKEQSKEIDIPAADTTNYIYEIEHDDKAKEFKFTIVAYKYVYDKLVMGIVSEKCYIVLDDADKTVVGISKTKTEGLVDTYTILYSNGSKSYFTVRNGKDGSTSDNGVSIASISQTGTEGTYAVYTVTMTDGNYTQFKVPLAKDGKNGIGIESIAYSASNGKVDIYTITYSDGKTSTFNVVNGLSAYEIAVKHGYEGSETQWLESLKGESAYEIAVRNGFIGTETEWLESLKGQNGTDGKNGKDGKDGANGSSYYGGGTTVINGKDGVGIADVTLSANGDLVVTLSDGSKKVAGNILTSVDLDSYLKAKIDAITGADESEHHDGDDKDTDGTDEEPDVANVFFSKVSRPSSVAKALSLKWTKAADVDGYEIRYCLKKDFKKSKTVVVVASNSKKSYQKLTIKELKGARTYYVQIRSYVEENGKKYYSDWSDAVSKKTLKKVAAKAASTT